MELAPAAVTPALAEGVNSFVSRTYGILLWTLLGVTLVGVAAYGWLPAGWVGPVGAANGVIWMLCGWFGWRRPVAVVLPIFAAINGLSLGLLAHSRPDVFLFAAILTLTAFSALTAYVHYTRQDFSFLNGFLFTAFFILVVGGLIVAFSGGRLASAGLSAFGTLVFLCWILYDTSEIVQRADEDGSTPGVAAFELLLDIIGLHSWLLDLLKETLGVGDSDQ